MMRKNVALVKFHLKIDFIERFNFIRKQKKSHQRKRARTTNYLQLAEKCIKQLFKEFTHLPKNVNIISAVVRRHGKISTTKLFKLHMENTLLFRNMYKYQIPNENVQTLKNKQLKIKKSD